jgi:hypothetical protein
MARVLMIDDRVTKRIAEIKAYAALHVFTMDQLKAIMKAGPSAAAGTDPGFRMIIPMGYRTVYTLEDQPEPVGRCTHVSISLDGPKGAMPHPIAVNTILQAFGIPPIEHKRAVYMGLEDIEDGGGKAVSIITPLSPYKPYSCN